MSRVKLCVSRLTRHRSLYYVRIDLYVHGEISTGSVNYLRRLIGDRRYGISPAKRTLGEETDTVHVTQNCDTPMTRGVRHAVLFGEVYVDRAAGVRHLYGAPVHSGKHVARWPLACIRMHPTEFSDGAGRARFARPRKRPRLKSRPARRFHANLFIA